MADRDFTKLTSLALVLAICALLAPGLVAAQSSFPEFRLPYPSRHVSGREIVVRWSGGPHQFGNLNTLGTYEQGLGSGIDFAGDAPDEHFLVLAMDGGEVIYTGWGSFGNQVAIQHAGGYVTIYGHLQSIRDGIAEGQPVSRGEPIGVAGNSNVLGRADFPVHLHVELRDGSPTCDVDKTLCVSPNGLGGNPVSWHSKIVDFVDGWMILEYRESETDVARVYNYDGLAVRRSGDDPAGPYDTEGFVYQDIDADNPRNNVTRTVFTWLPKEFECSPSTGTCENNKANPNVQFSGHGIFGGGGVLLTTNEPIELETGIEVFEITPGPDAYLKRVSDPQIPVLYSSDYLNVSFRVSSGIAYLVAINLTTGSTRQMAEYQGREGQWLVYAGELDSWDGVMGDHHPVDFCLLNVVDGQVIDDLCTTIFMAANRGCMPIRDGGSGCPWDFPDFGQLQYHHLQHRVEYDTEGAVKSLIQAGARARVTCSGGSNRLRMCAGLNCSVVGEIPPCGEVAVFNGPKESDGYRWWEVEYRGIIGWTAEGDGVTYWLEPIN